MGLSYVPAVALGLVLVVGILAQIGTALDDMDNIAWIPGGWSVASAVSFAIAGGLSDIFGRRYVLIGGQVVVLIGAVSKQCPNPPVISRQRQLIVLSTDCWRHCANHTHCRLWIYTNWLWSGSDFRILSWNYRIAS